MRIVRKLESLDKMKKLKWIQEETKSQRYQRSCTLARSLLTSLKRYSSLPPSNTSLESDPNSPLHMNSWRGLSLIPTPIASSQLSNQTQESISKRVDTPQREIEDSDPFQKLRQSHLFQRGFKETPQCLLDFSRDQEEFVKLTPHSLNNFEHRVQSSEANSNYAGSEIEEVRRFPPSPRQSVSDKSFTTHNNSAVFKKKQRGKVPMIDSCFDGIDDQNQTPKKKDPRHSQVKFKEREVTPTRQAMRKEIWFYGGRHQRNRDFIIKAKQEGLRKFIRESPQKSLEKILNIVKGDQQFWESDNFEDQVLALYSSQRDDTKTRKVRSPLRMKLNRQKDNTSHLGFSNIFSKRSPFEESKNTWNIEASPYFGQNSELESIQEGGREEEVRRVSPNPSTAKFEEEPDQEYFSFNT